MLRTKLNTMNGRKPYFAKNTSRILKAVMPEEFKMVKDDTSKGYKLVNLLYGVEVDLIYDYLDQARHVNNLSILDYGTDSDLYEVVLRDNTIYNTINGDGYDIKITNKDEFYDGAPTRIEYMGELYISGLSYGITGLEYLRTDAQGSGILLINLDVDSETAFANSDYQTLKIKSDDLGNFDVSDLSGYNLSISNQSYEKQGRDEILVPEFYKELERKYPLTKSIKAPRSGELDAAYFTYTVDHYTPDNGQYWNINTSGYTSIGYDTDHYYDPTGNKIYYRTAYNNPYGTGVYDTVYLTLENTPISGTLRVYDIDILDSSNSPVEISGSKQSYFHSGVYSGDQYAYYIGYASGVPREYLPLEESGYTAATEYKLTTWDYCRESGGLDDRFNWVEYPTNNIINRIKIENPISRYLVTYYYQNYKRNKYTTTPNSTKYIRLDDKNYLFSTLGTNDNEVEIDTELSHDTRTDRKGVTFKGLDVRPGSTINRLEISEDVELIGNDFNKSNITLMLEYDTAGYSDTIIPNKNDNKVYLIDHNFNDISGQLELTGDDSRLINYDSYYGTRLTHSDGQLYFSTSGFIDLETTPETTPLMTVNNRYVKLAFKQCSPINSGFILAESSDGSGSFWSISLLSDGFVQVTDQDVLLRTYDKIPESKYSKEIILERDMQFNNDKNEHEYGIFYKEGDSHYKTMDFAKFYNANSVPSGVITKFFVNSTLDVKYAQIYEEPKVYNE